MNTSYPVFSARGAELLKNSTVCARVVTPLFEGAAVPRELVERDLRMQVADFLSRERATHTRDEAAGLEVHELRLMVITEEALFRLVREEAMRYVNASAYFGPAPPLRIES